LLRPGTAALRNGRLRPAAASPIGAPASGTVRRRPFSTSRAGRPALRFMDSFGVAAAHRAVHPPQYGYGGRALRQREWFLKTRDMDVLFQGVALGCPVPGFQRVLWRVTHKKRRGAFIFMMSSEFGQVQIAIQVKVRIHFAPRPPERNEKCGENPERFSSTTETQRHREDEERADDNSNKRRVAENRRGGLRTLPSSALHHSSCARLRITASASSSPTSPDHISRPVF